MKTPFHSLFLAGVVASAVVVPLQAQRDVRCAEDRESGKKLTADEVIEQWAPKPERVRSSSYHHLGASPAEDGVAAYAFRVEGLSIETLWNHYAGLCGVKDRYDAKAVLNVVRKTEKGVCVLANQIPTPTDPSRVSTFLIKTERYVVTVTLQHHPDGKTITGSVTAVVP
jgi:hypothetical protein